MPEPVPTLTLFSRSDCHLCDVARERIQALRRRIVFEVETVDISENPEQQASYGERIPVVVLAGEEVAVYRVNPKKLEEKLIAAGAKPRGWRRLLGRAP